MSFYHCTPNPLKDDPTGRPNLPLTPGGGTGTGPPWTYSENHVIKLVNSQIEWSFRNL